ncbi:MAG: hypothetical protein ONB55_22330, partial [candidate division KSB1 bacterium]|nr:hypothetical protein [candidate division KSB1 bacterium]
RIGVELDKFSGNRSEIRNAIHNKTAANSLVAKEIGLPDGALLTDDALSAAAKPHYAVYDNIRDALKRPFKLDDELLTQEAKAAAARTVGPIDIPKKDLKIVNKLSGPIDGGSMLKYIDELRTEGFRNLRTPSAGSEKLARYYLDLANSLESRLGRVLAQKGMPDLANQYQNARRAIAKIETAKAARVGYDIDPAYLARLDSATNKLDGGMKIIAETYKHFPRNFRIRVGVEENLVSPFGAEASSLLGARSLAGVIHSKFFSTVKGFDDPKYAGPSGPLRQFYRPPAQTPPPAGLLPRRGDVPITGYPPSPPGTNPQYPWGDSRIAPPSVKRLPSPNDTLSGGAAYKPSRASIVEKPFDAISHPGSANRMPEPERLMLAEAIAKRGAQNEGIPLADVMIEPVAKKTTVNTAGREVRVIEQGDALKQGYEKMKAAPGAGERGMALEMALQGKKVPKQHKTFLARAIEQRAKKEK